MAITERRLALNEEERHLVGVKPKLKRREENRERKALAAAKIEKAIEKELLERLKSGAYGDKPLNVDENIWKKVLGKVDEVEQEEEFDDDDEEEVELESEEEEDEDDMGEVEYVEDSGEDDLVDMEDLEKWLDDSSDNESESESEGESDDDEEGEGSSKKRKADDTKTKQKEEKTKS